MRIHRMSFFQRVCRGCHPPVLHLSGEIASGRTGRKKKNKTKNKKAKHGATAGLATLEANGEGMGVDDNNDDKSPLHVFFDIEAMQDTGRHIPNLLISETQHDDRPFRFKGEHCVRDSQSNFFLLDNSVQGEKVHEVIPM